MTEDSIASLLTQMHGTIGSRLSQLAALTILSTKANYYESNTRAQPPRTGRRAKKFSKVFIIFILFAYSHDCTR
eukprot:2865191-Pleurochrysis_carterae.AAC.1